MICWQFLTWKRVQNGRVNGMETGESMNEFTASSIARRLNVLLETQKLNGPWKHGFDFRFVMYFSDFDL